VPGTNPFFPLPNDLQGNRFLELLQTHPIDVYLMNTGWIVDDKGPDSKKITVAHSSHCLNAVAEGGAEWTVDPDFGYEVAEHVPGIEDTELLQPRKAFERLGKLDDYHAWVEKLRSERRAFLQTFPDLDPYIIEGI
jgi:phosphoenolpyruvate carboxykinase (ATP)